MAGNESSQLSVPSPVSFTTLNASGGLSTPFSNHSVGSGFAEHELSLTESAVVAVSSILLLLTIVIGPVGNVSVIAVVVHSKILRTPFNALVLCLSTADLLICALTSPIYLYMNTMVWTRDSSNSQQNNIIVCQLHIFSSTFAFALSITTLVAISLTRALKMTGNCGTTFRMKRVVATAITTNLALASTFAVFKLETPNSALLLCFLWRQPFDIQPSWFRLSLGFLVTCYVLMSVSYFYVLSKVQRSVGALHHQSPGAGGLQQGSVVRIDIATVKVVAVIVCVFSVTYLPLAIQSQFVPANLSVLTITVNGICRSWAYFGSALNPIVYIACSRVFSDHLKAVCRRLASSCRAAVAATTTTDVVPMDPAACHSKDGVEIVSQVKDSDEKDTRV